MGLNFDGYVAETRRKAEVRHPGSHLGSLLNFWRLAFPQHEAILWRGAFLSSDPLVFSPAICWRPATFRHEASISILHNSFGAVITDLKRLSEQWFKGF